MGLNVYQTIRNEYEKRQQKAQEGLVRKREEVYSRVPRIEEIDDEIQHIGIKYNKDLLSGLITPENAAGQLKREIAALKRERTSLLKDSGFPENYLNPSYTCDKCRDTGVIKSESGPDEMCPCFRQMLINNIYSSSNLRLTGSEGFRNFNEIYYPDIIDEGKYGIKKSPRKQATGIKNNCLKFIEEFKDPETKNMLFCGPTGVGKTFTAQCIAVELMNRGITVLYQTAPVLFNSINEYRFKANKDEAYEADAYRSMLEVELLIIDDLGTEPQSAARYAELLTILDTRHSNNLRRPCKTIIATNIEPRKLYEYYDERIASRIIGSFDIIKFAGEDIRKFKDNAS